MDIISLMVWGGVLWFLVNYLGIRIRMGLRTITTMTVAAAIILFPEHWIIIASVGFGLIGAWWMSDNLDSPIISLDKPSSNTDIDKPRKKLKRICKELESMTAETEKETVPQEVEHEKDEKGKGIFYTEEENRMF